MYIRRTAFRLVALMLAAALAGPVGAFAAEAPVTGNAVVAKVGAPSASDSSDNCGDRMVAPPFRDAGAR